MRFLNYITIILVVITGNFNYLLIILFVAIITYLIHLNIDHYEDKKIEKSLENYQNISEDKDIQKRNIKPKNI